MHFEMGICFHSPYFGIVNHLEERLLDQAQARSSLPPFWGVIRVAQGMIFDVQPLVNDYFAQYNDHPMDFLILGPLSGEIGYHFFGGGVGGGGGQKFVRRGI